MTRCDIDVQVKGSRGLGLNFVLRGTKGIGEGSEGGLFKKASIGSTEWNMCSKLVKERIKLLRGLRTEGTRKSFKSPFKERIKGDDAWICF